MISTSYARTMSAYNAWMNERVYGFCSQVSDAERKRDVGAFFKSIHGTLNHLLLADRIWMGRFAGLAVTPASLAQELYSDFDELQRERRDTDRAIGAWIDGLSQADLERELTYTTIVNPQRRSTPLWFALAHFFNHQTHHRGQLTTLLVQRGIDPGVTDLLWVPDGPRP
jgi:uncharacterized damage-inducible protein DinB